MAAEALRQENDELKQRVKDLEHELRVQTFRAKRLQKIMVRNFMTNYAIPKISRVRKAIDKRGRIMVEIIQTEQGFQKNLRTVITKYLNPLRKETSRELLGAMGLSSSTLLNTANQYALTKEEHSALFNNIEDLYLVLSDFYTDLGRAFGLHETFVFDRSERKSLGVILNCEDGTKDVEVSAISREATVSSTHCQLQD